MSKCINCQIEVLDDTECCPLCRAVLVQTEELENIYPDVRPRMHRLNFYSRVYLFFALVLEGILLGLDLLMDSPVKWSIVDGMVFLYVYAVVRYAILGRSGHRGKIIILSAIGVLSAIGIDMVVGYQGWSVAYVLPAGILIVDVMIMGCMIWNRRNWQSYIMWQLFMILCSLVPVFIYVVRGEGHRHLVMLPMAVSLILFLGTMILGDRRARTELKRRFHTH